MNKIFKRIWNAKKGCVVAVHEAAGCGQTRGIKKAVAAVVVGTLISASGTAFAVPEYQSADIDSAQSGTEFWTIMVSGNAPLDIDDGYTQYVKYLDNNGNWAQVDLTNGYLLSDEAYNYAYLPDYATHSTKDQHLLSGAIMHANGDASSIGFNIIYKTFTNDGTLYAVGGSSSDIYGFYQTVGNFVNNSALIATAGTGSSAIGFYSAGGTFTNQSGGTITATGSEKSIGMELDAGLANEGTINATGGSGASAYGIYVKGTVTNSGEIISNGGSYTTAAGIYSYKAAWTNTGKITATSDSAHGIDFYYGSVY